MIDVIYYQYNRSIHLTDGVTVTTLSAGHIQKSVQPHTSYAKMH